MPINILFVGLASDGPSNVCEKIQTDRELLQMFGGNYIQRTTVSPTASSITCDYMPLQLPSNVVDLVKKDYLFSPYTSGSVVSFGTIGSSIDHTVDLTYTPYLGKGDLITAARRHREILGTSSWVARIGGELATLDLGSWIFEAKHPGTRYNNVSVSMGSTGITIFGLEPNFPTLTYTSSSLWHSEITRDYRLGICPIRVKTAGNSVLTFTATLTGGADGSFSADSLNKFLDYTDIPSEVTHVVLLTEATNALSAEIINHLQEASVQPRLFMVNAPAYTAPASTWATSMQTTLSRRHNLIAFVVGDVGTTWNNIFLERHAVEAAAIGLGRVQGYNITNTPVDALTFDPILTEVELNLLKRAGFMTLMRYIKNDISVYEGVCSAGDKSFLYNTKVAEILSLARQNLAGYLGYPLVPGPQPQMAQILHTSLVGVQFAKIESVTINAYRETIYVTIVAAIPKEILTISFTIKNR